MPARLEELRELARRRTRPRRPGRAAGGLDESTTEEVAQVLGRLEAALRARTAGASL